MKRVAFVMQLHKGKEDEYLKRHQELWPELHSLLKIAGISDYSLFIHPSTWQLFGFLRIPDERLLDDLAREGIMQKWWTYMKDIMETNEDFSPVSIPLKEVFYLP